MRTRLESWRAVAKTILAYACIVGWILFLGWLDYLLIGTRIVFPLIFVGYIAVMMWVAFIIGSIDDPKTSERDREFYKDALNIVLFLTALRLFNPWKKL